MKRGGMEGKEAFSNDVSHPSCAEETEEAEESQHHKVLIDDGIFIGFDHDFSSIAIGCFTVSVVGVCMCMFIWHGRARFIMSDGRVDVRISCCISGIVVGSDGSGISSDAGDLGLRRSSIFLRGRDMARMFFTVYVVLCSLGGLMWGLLMVSGTIKVRWLLDHSHIVLVRLLKRKLMMALPVRKVLELSVDDRFCFLDLCYDTSILAR